MKKKSSSMLLAIARAKLHPPAPPTPETFSQTEAWAAEPSWDELTPAEQLLHLEADELGLRRRIDELRREVPRVTASAADPRAE